MIGVILAAGNGKRLKESSKEDYCKPLIKIKGKRLIEYSLDNLVNLNVDEVYIVVGKEGNLIETVLGDKYNDLNLHYIMQSEPKGLMDAFIQAIRVVGCKKTIILQLSDEVFVGLEAKKIADCLGSKTFDFYCGVTLEEDTEKIKTNYSVDADKEYVIRKCVEKPTKVINNIKGTGFCIFSREALRVLEKEDIELYDLCDYINYLTDLKLRGLALVIAVREFNINTFADLFEVQNFLYPV